MTLWMVQDDSANPRKKYGGLSLFTTWTDGCRPIPSKYIDTEISYYHSYYFTSKCKALSFMDKLAQKYDNR